LKVCKNIFWRSKKTSLAFKKPRKHQLEDQPGGEDNKRGQIFKEKMKSAVEIIILRWIFL